MKFPVVIDKMPLLLAFVSISLKCFLIEWTKYCFVRICFVFRMSLMLSWLWFCMISECQAQDPTLRSGSNLGTVFFVRAWESREFLPVLLKSGRGDLTVGYLTISKKILFEKSKEVFFLVIVISFKIQASSDYEKLMVGKNLLLCDIYSTRVKLFFPLIINLMWLIKLLVVL